MSGEIERLYRDQGARLWRALLAWSGDPEIANDAVAEAFMQLIRRGNEVRDPQPWVWRAAFRIAAGELKARRRRLDTAEMAERTAEIPETVDLIRALSSLSPKQRAAVVLHHYAGYPVSEIATIIGSSSAAVRVHLSAGRKRLRSILGEGNRDED